MKLIVGFGNPGEQYEKTRHNLGFMVLDRLAMKHDTEIEIKKKKSVMGRLRLGDKQVVLLKPQIFVNLSGEAVLYMASFLRIHPEDIIVIYNDVNLSMGEVRMRKYGSSEGHSGMRSLIQSLRTDNFPRVRIGIGGTLGNMSLSNFVLGQFTREELSALDPVVDQVCEALELWVGGRMNDAIRMFEPDWVENAHKRA